MQIKIILPLYNVEKWINLTFNSVKKQTYTNYKAIFLNDLSNDSTLEKLETLTKDDDRFIIHTNENRLFSMGNLWYNIPKVTSSDDYIVILDGDDWFSNETVLEEIVSKFKDGYKFIHGQYLEYPKMLLVDEGKYEQETIKNCSYRRDRWRCSGLRAFNRKLWDSININDVTREESFYKFAADLAYTFPMLENSNGKIYRFNKPIHIYNKSNPLNDDKISRQEQLLTELKIRNITYDEYITMMQKDNLILRQTL